MNVLSLTRFIFLRARIYILPSERIVSFEFTLYAMDELLSNNPIFSEGIHGEFRWESK